jgi:hypothetical protein
VFYSIEPIFDSNSSQAPWIQLPFNAKDGETIPHKVQMFRCALSFVGRTAIVDASSGQLVSFVEDTQVDNDRRIWLSSDAIPTSPLTSPNPVDTEDPQNLLDLVSSFSLTWKFSFNVTCKCFSGKRGTLASECPLPILFSMI